MWLIPSALAAPASLDTYTDLVAALEGGERVRAILHYGQCLLPSEDGPRPAPDATGGMEFTVFEAFAKGAVRNPAAFVSTSETRLISHPSYGTVLNYGRLKVYEDGRAEVLARYLDPKSFKVRMDETLDCTLGEGVRLYVDR